MAFPIGKEPQLMPLTILMQHFDRVLPPIQLRRVEFS